MQVLGLFDIEFCTIQGNVDDDDLNDGFFENDGKASSGKETTGAHYYDP